MCIARIKVCTFCMVSKKEPFNVENCLKSSLIENVEGASADAKEKVNKSDCEMSKSKFNRKEKWIIVTKKVVFGRKLTALGSSI